MTDNEIIVVKQLPIIEEQLQEISSDIQERVNAVLLLDCTEENCKEIKKYRAELGKMFTDIENRRKDVKRKILTPYERFEEVYKRYITDIFKPADEQIKSKIQAVENKLKNEKIEAAKSYFNEYAESFGIDFVKFEDMKVNVTMSMTLKHLKDLTNEFINRICEDLNLISTQEHKEEILVEYKRTLCVSKAITDVTNRHKAVEEEKARAEKAKREAESIANIEQKVDDAVFYQDFAIPKKVEPKKTEESHTSDKPASKLYETSFRVRGTIDELKALKKFLETERINYEQL